MDMDFGQLHDMVALNVQTVWQLTYLYGRLMTQRRRGRILTVSSICGATAGIPCVALYTATKAFEKALSCSLAQELEPFGVGLTCLMPGAVVETEFRRRSLSHQALTWKLPFVLKKPEQIAEIAIRALLRGDVEVVPGLANRGFVHVGKSLLPQRLHNIVAEIMWSPPESLYGSLRLTQPDRQKED